MVAALTLTLPELGVPAQRVASRPLDNLLTFAGMNHMLEEATGAGKAFILRKPLLKLDDAQHIFARTSGNFISLAYHIPDVEEGAGERMPYAMEAMGCRCELASPVPSPSLATASARRPLRDRRRGGDALRQDLCRRTSVSPLGAWSGRRCLMGAAIPSHAPARLGPSSRRCTRVLAG